MPEDRPWYQDHRPPIPVDGGIRARNRRGSIGSRWWSRRFIDLVESFADQGRLQRGRSYARKGQVIDLKVRPYEVTARVQGSRYEPYEVAVGIEAISDATWAAAEEELAARAVFRARLLAGEMPPEIEEVFAELGAPLFPESAADLHLMCTCPDYGDPCKHAAAVLYLLAEAFDDDPFLVLAWNGRDKARLMAGLRRRVPAAPDPFDVEDRPLTADGFWTPPAGLARLRDRRVLPDLPIPTNRPHRPPRPTPAYLPAAPAAPPGLLLKLLDPPAVKVRRRDLIDVLAPAYEALGGEPGEPGEPDEQVNE